VHNKFFFIECFRQDFECHWLHWVSKVFISTCSFINSPNAGSKSLQALKISYFSILYSGRGLLRMVTSIHRVASVTIIASVANRRFDRDSIKTFGQENECETISTMRRCYDEDQGHGNGRCSRVIRSFLLDTLICFGD